MIRLHGTNFVCISCWRVPCFSFSQHYLLADLPRVENAAAPTP